MSRPCCGSASVSGKYRKLSLLLQSGGHGFESEPQERARLKLDAEGHNGIGCVFQPQAEGTLVPRAKVASAAADRDQAIAARLHPFEHQQILLLVVDIAALGAAAPLLQ